MAYREFKDENGRDWRAWDVAEPRYAHRSSGGIVPPEFAHGWLAFESGNEKRRLCPYPKGWASMSDTELERLLGIAKVARSPGAGDEAEVRE
jgi:hypothetical protein